MNGGMASRTGGEILVDALKLHGTDTVFGVPGESYLAVLDALHGSSNAVRFITCRQEGGAAFMAEAYGKMTGRPGVCFVTRGPGACNASIGVHTAFQDSTPMILFVGQVGRDMREREAFQEVEYRLMFAPMAKWVTEVQDPARLPELIARAYRTATSGRPGPVVLALPEDMLRQSASVPDGDPYSASQPGADPAVMDALRDRLSRAERPLMILGGGGWTGPAIVDIAAFAEMCSLPVATSFRCQDYFDNRHLHYVGDVGIAIDPKLADRVRRADVLLVVGPRLGEMTTQGYTLLEVPRPAQTLIHVHPGAEELGRVYQPDLAINAGMAAFAHAARMLKPIEGTTWSQWLIDARRDYEAGLKPGPQPGALDMGQVMAVLAERLPDDAIIANGAGNYTGWVHKYRRFVRYRSQLAPTNGTMGYGVPAAAAAKLVEPDRTVVAFAGDGCFLMNGQELATIMQYGLDPLILVINNGMYGTIRMHQEREYPGRVSGSDLANPDFAAYATAFGLHAETVARTEEFAPALDRALAAGRAALIELRVDPEGITPRTTLTALRKAAEARRG